METAGHKILIVDDNEAIRRVTRSALERVGYEILDAVDGESAVDLFRKVHPSIGLVLMDLSMPGIDGEESLRRLRRISAGVRVLMMSGYDEPVSLTGDDRLAFIQKPFLPAELREKVAELLPQEKEQTG